MHWISSFWFLIISNLAALEVVKVLVEHNAKIYANAICDAAIHDRNDSNSLFDPLKPTKFIGTEKIEKNFWFPFESVSISETGEMTQFLIEHGANVNLRVNGETPLAMAIRHGILLPLV